MPPIPDAPDATDVLLISGANETDVVTDPAIDAGQPTFRFPEHPLTSWKIGQPIPLPEHGLLEACEGHLEALPEGFEIEDVEAIWWMVAACFGYAQLRDELVPVVERRKDWSCFVFSPIADLHGEGRYPSEVIRLLREILPSGSIFPVDPKSLGGAEQLSDLLGTLLIQNEIWHELTMVAWDLIPLSVLPDHMRDNRFAGDLGL